MKLVQSLLIGYVGKLHHNIYRDKNNLKGLFNAAEGDFKKFVHKGPESFTLETFQRKPSLRKCLTIAVRHAEMFC